MFRVHGSEYTSPRNMASNVLVERPRSYVPKRGERTLSPRSRRTVSPRPGRSNGEMDSSWMAVRHQCAKLKLELQLQPFQKESKQ